MGGGGAPERCEALLGRLTASADGEKPLELLRLSGTGVPGDVEMYVCQRTLVAIQVRIKNLDQPKGLVHEYGFDPGTVGPCSKGGVYELRCQRSQHQLQLKVQPALGLAALLPVYKEEPSEGDLGLLLQTMLWPFLAVFQLLFAFSSDAARTSVPLSGQYKDAPKNIDWLMADAKMLDQLCERCPIFRRSYDSPPTLSLSEPERPKTRGLLQKALLEVKTLLIRALSQIRAKSDLLSPQQSAAFEELMVYVYQDCCAGGVDQQYYGAEESAQRLRRLVCGGEDGAQEEQGRLQRLWKALESACRLVASAGESLGEAVPLAQAQRFQQEVAATAELSGQLKRRLEEVEAELEECAKRGKPL